MQQGQASMQGQARTVAGASLLGGKRAVSGGR